MRIDAFTLLDGASGSVLYDAQEKPRAGFDVNPSGKVGEVRDR
jgi:hypothetical protein